jgi:kynurenine formamidase
MIEKVCRKHVRRRCPHTQVGESRRGLASSIFQAALPASLVLLAFLPFLGTAQTRQQGPWWPHPQWGPEDQAGASNWMTEAKVMRAVRLVTTGKVYELGHVYERGMPLYGDRTFSLVIPAPFPPSRGENAPSWFIDYFSGELGQLGTQFDALGHTGMKMKMADGSEKEVFYNGFTRDEINSPAGLRALGVEKARPIITRGILLDIAGLKEVPALSSRYEVTVADVRGALARQGMREESIEPGDAILFNYGWARNWGNASLYNDSRIGVGQNNGSPGIGVAAARWIAERKASLVGADSCCVEVDPNPDPKLDHPVHQELIMRHGIFMLENLELRGLAAERVYEFMFIFTPLPFKGASGSPGRPLAIR